MCTGNDMRCKACDCILNDIDLLRTDRKGTAEELCAVCLRIALDLDLQEVLADVLEDEDFYVENWDE